MKRMGRRKAKEYAEWVEGILPPGWDYEIAVQPESGLVVIQATGKGKTPPHRHVLRAVHTHEEEEYATKACVKTLSLELRGYY